jgi:hypothetical protein
VFQSRPKGCIYCFACSRTERPVPTLPSFQNDARVAVRFTFTSIFPVGVAVGRGRRVQSIVPVTASTPSRLLAGSREDTRLAQMYGVGADRGKNENLKGSEERGVALPTKTTTPPMRFTTQTLLSYTPFVCVASLVMNNIYGVISCTQAQN